MFCEPYVPRIYVLKRPYGERITKDLQPMGAPLFLTWGVHIALTLIFATATGQMKGKISGRIGLARRAPTRLKSALQSRRDNLPQNTCFIYEALNWTILL